MDTTFRMPTQKERLLLDHLLSLPFRGRDELRFQLATVEVRPIDDDGSLLLHPLAGEPRAPVNHRVPTEGEYVDQDGVRVHVLLHVNDGMASELEIYKDSSCPIIWPVETERLILFSPDRFHDVTKEMNFER